MRVRVDARRCLASGVCQLKAPSVFGQDDEGLVTLLDPAPSTGLPAVRAAAGSCPAEAIQLEPDAGELP